MENVNEEIEYLTVVNEDGSEELLEILFTFTSQDNRNFVICVKDVIDEAGEDLLEIYSFIYEEGENASEGTLIDVTSEEDLAMIDEMLETFFESEEE